MEELTLYTVGHSNQSQEEFLALIRSRDIDCIIDVRSMPYSKYTSQFNSEVLKAFLNKNGILYAHFGEEFGARRSDCLKNENFSKKGVTEVKPQVNFELGINTPNFLKGVERLKKALSQGRHVSLMCSEADPLGCHRFSFLSRYFYEQGWNVQHIIKDENSGEGIIRSHKDLENDMILEYVHAHKLKEIDGQGGMSLFSMSDFCDGYNADLQRIDAYRLKNHEIGWIPANSDNEEEFID